MARRRHHRAIGISHEIRTRLKGIVWLLFAVLLFTVPLYLMSLAPNYYIYASNTTIGVGPSVPAHSAAVGLNVVLALVVFAIAIFAVIKAARALGVEL